MVGKGARFLAPIALVAVAVGVYLLVHSAFAHHAMISNSTTAAVVNTRRGGRSGHHRLQRIYVVRAGDTLSAIAARTGVPVSQITTLNPSLANSPNSLQTGQRLRLRR
ncbi:MAG: LysM domain-containing protein [Solirubrobacteraceae bacterium]